MSFITPKIAINKSSIGSYYLDVSGNINVDGSILQYGIPISGGTLSGDYIKSASTGSSLKWSSELLDVSVISGGRVVSTDTPNNNTVATVYKNIPYFDSSNNIKSNTLFHYDPSGRFDVKQAFAGSTVIEGAFMGDHSNNLYGNLLCWGKTDNNKRLAIGFNSSTNYGYLQSYYSGGAKYPVYINPEGGNAYISPNGVTYIGSSSFNGIITCSSSARFADGENTVPSISFENDTDTGFYRNTSGRIDITTNAVNNFRFDVSTFHARGDIVAFSSTFSDKRLKTNIIQIPNGLENILKLNGISYEPIDQKGTIHYGLIAQEVEEIIPEIVVEYEKLGTNNVYKSLRYTELIPHLIEAIKAQQKQIDNLSSEIKLLKNQ